MKERTIRKESSKTDREELNTNLLSVHIKNNKTGEILFEQELASIVFAGVTEVHENGYSFSSGITGEFNTNSLLQSVEAVLDAVAQTLKNSYDIDAEQFIEIMAKIISETTQRNFSESERKSAMLAGLTKLLKKAKK